MSKLAEEIALEIKIQGHITGFEVENVAALIDQKLSGVREVLSPFVAANEYQDVENIHCSMKIIKADCEAAAQLNESLRVE